ncbi:MAG: NlpC/P60 family protein [Lachnospiraceae bacterium]
MKRTIKILTLSCLCALVTGNMSAYATATKSVNEVAIVSAKKADFENIAVSQVTGYVNIRTQPTTSSDIVGKIYNNCAATIEETVEGEGGSWYKIKSGTVEGYIKAQYFITGEQAEQLAQQIGKEFATINTESLRLRERPDLNSNTLTLLSKGARYVVLAEEDDFYKVEVDADLEGYIAKSYCTTTIEFDQAVSLAEERQQQAEETQRKQEADAAIAALEQAKKSDGSTGGSTELIIETNPEKSNNDQKASAPTPAASQSESGDSSTQNSPAGSGSTAVNSATRTAIVAYAKQFLGNPYVYGGTSLTNGADCSGFTQSIFANFGLSIGRSSRDQAEKGKEISVDSVQPGDLLFYASGDYINHVAIYIGNGQVIHASNSTTGIIISPSNYRSPSKAVTFLD